MANTGFLIQPQLKKEVITSDYASMSGFPATGTAGVFYKALDTGLVYRWVSSAYVEVDPSLDVNNDLCEESGLPQATMANPTDSPTYRVLNTDACPVDPSSEVILSSEITAPDPQTGGTNRYGAKFILSETIDNNLIINYTIRYEDVTSQIKDYDDEITLDTGYLDVETAGYVALDGSPSGSANVIINSVTPNPNGSKTIIY